METTGGRETTIPDTAVAALDSLLGGQLMRPGDDAYDAARQVWNGMVDKRPALIARCTGAEDVANAVRFAREHDVLTSVRCGGHNIAGKAVSDRGLMIDLSGMRGVTVDPARRTALVGGGALLGDLDRATQAFGLATTAGVVTHTGVGGLTLGGGVGRLARREGLACDNLLAAEVVTATGDMIQASPTENEDLFWGLRGGGGNFGIVTRFEFELHPVGPTVFAGLLLYDLGQAAAALMHYDEYMRAAPDELAADAAFLTAPDGRPLFAISACYVGPIERGERVLRGLRSFGPPLSDDIKPMSYLDVQASTDAFFPIGLSYYWKSHFLTRVTAEAAELTVSTFARVPSPRSVLIFQQYGGAVSRIENGATAFFHRSAQFDNFAASIWSGPGEADVQRSWVRVWWDAMLPHATGGEYVNNLGEEGEDRVRAAYGTNYERLVALKRRWDPTNFFRLNANIPPHGAPVVD